ncbi:MAG TPA: hypothetical protein VJQ82_18005 [Terriglobales bacterium]|nr:hypothetical protein [Terriglobales bacterium]
MHRFEPVLLLLSGLVIFFTACLFASEHFFKDDGQMFQVVSNLLSGFGGALLMRVKPASKSTESADPAVTAKPAEPSSD